MWCKQGNSGKDRRLNNEQWSRIEQVTLARACIESPGPGHVLCGNTAWSHSGSQYTSAPGEESWGRWAGTLGNSDKTLWLFMEMSHGMKHTMFFCVWVSVSGRRTVRQRSYYLPISIFIITDTIDMCGTRQCLAPQASLIR